MPGSVLPNNAAGDRRWGQGTMLCVGCCYVGGNKQCQEECIQGREYDQNDGITLRNVC